MKSVISILLATSIFYSTNLFALPVGNPSAASLFISNELCKSVDCESFLSHFDGLSLHLGYYGDYVWNRSLKTVANRHIDYSRISTNAGYLALNCRELLEFFAIFGVSKFSLNTSLVAFNITNPKPRFNFETSSSFSWSVGGHATIWRYKCFVLGMMAQYFTCKPRTDVWFIRANISAHPNKDRSRYSECQLGGGISWTYSRYFVPYIAIKWSRALWEFNNQPLFFGSGGVPVATLINLKSSKQLGCAIGLSFVPFECKHLSVTVEGRFGDEAAAHVNGQLSF